VRLADPAGRAAADLACVERLRAEPQYVRVVTGRAGEPIAELERLLTTVQPPDLVRDLFDLFAYHPDTVLNDIVPRLGVSSTWTVTVSLYEAWWRLAATGQLAGVEPRGQRTAAAYFARTRWLLYCLPFRLGTDSRIDADDRHRLATPEQLVSRAREARQDWLAVLDAIEDHSLLERDIHPEHEARDLLDCPVNLSQLGGTVPSRTDPIDAEVWRHCVRRHLLPRFAVGASWRIGWRLSGRLSRANTIIAAVMFTAAVALGLLSASRRWPGASDWLLTAATAAAGAGYAAVLAASVRNRAASWPWLLRQPASATLGAVALVALNPGWWSAGTSRPKAGAAAILVALAVGYLTIEAINHGVAAGWPLLRRVAAVSAMAAMHATIIGALVLRWLAPALSENGDALTALWSTAGAPAGTPAAGYTFALAAAWCFAAGVFSQILWDEQPFTAPLAHLGWRNGR